MDRRLFTVIKKELKRIFTDRRLVFTTMILPALSIFVLYSLMGNMLSDKADDVDNNIPEVVVVTASESFNTYSNEVDLEKKYNITWVDSQVDIQKYKDEIFKGDIELLLIFEEGFDGKVKALINPNVERYYNGVEDYSSQARYTMDQVLMDYETYLLGVRIGNPDHVSVFDLNKGVENDALHDAQKEAGKGLSILFPMLIAMFLFSGAMSVGPDMIAGEKERGTMATLLVTPVRRETLAMGKVIALAIVAMVSALSSFIGIIASMPSAGKMFASDGISMSSLQFSSKEYFYLAAIMLTLVGLYVSVVCLVSILSKTIKEANTYMSPIYMLVMISGFSTMYLDGAISNSRFFIPVYGSVIALKKLFSFELTGNMVLYTCGMSLVISFVLIYLIKILFNNEKVMFSK